MNDLCHIRINGKPACERPADPFPLLDRSRQLKIPLVCSGQRRELAPLVTLYREYYENVEIVDGGCTSYEAVV